MIISVNILCKLYYKAFYLLMFSLVLSLDLSLLFFYQGNMLTDECSHNPFMSTLHVVIMLYVAIFRERTTSKYNKKGNKHFFYDGVSGVEVFAVDHTTLSFNCCVRPTHCWLLALGNAINQM